MPLPSPNTPFPPHKYLDVVADIALAQAWWEGSQAKLAGQHSDNGHTNTALGGSDSSRSGRMFWGGQRRKGAPAPRRLHIPIAADLCSTSAAVLLPDPAAFKLPTRDGVTLGNEQAQQRLDLTLNTAEHHARMLSAAEVCAALGGTYPRVVWNADVADHAWLDYVDADRALPEFVYGKLSAVTFWTVLEDDGANVVRHFERYEKGRIQHGLYHGTLASVGHSIPLAAHPETKGIPANDEGWIATGTKFLAADYIPNASLNPKWRNKGQLRNLGRSDLTDPAVISLMDAIDETYTSLARDIRLAKGRIVVSDYLLDTHGPGKGATFDLDQEVFAPVGGMPNGAPMIEAHQFEIRVDEHLRTADAYLRQILMRVGYDPSTFGLQDNGAAMTATEVDSRDRRSTATHKAKSGLWKSGHGNVSRALVEIDAAVFRTGALIGEPVEVSWPSAARETDRQRAETVKMLEDARAVSTETKVALMWPAWDEDRRAEEVDRIKAEQQVAGDPFAIGADMPMLDTAVEPETDELLDEILDEHITDEQRAEAELDEAA